ncbi:MAG TPA: DUF3592 domain-containing protein [Gemmataceae bacterium]|nr:DUF3592 domain-containing protein [Gemmataceae bacterium]
MPTEFSVAGLTPYAAFAFGGLGLRLGLAFLADTVWFLCGAAHAAGVLVGHEARPSRDADGATTYLRYPVVEFRDTAGGAPTMTLNHGASGPPRFGPGREVALLHRPGDPAGVRIRCFIHLWLFPAMALGLGAWAVAFGLVWQAQAEG